MNSETRDLSEEFWDGKLTPNQYADDVSRRLGTDVPDLRAIFSVAVAAVRAVTDDIRKLLS
jgi:hypothetical protein